MSRIAEKFQELKLAERNALIVFFTAGDPDIGATERFILAATRAGADIVEIGIPFSDPVAEGEVIQRANARALASGTKIADIFEMVVRLRTQTQVPLVFLTYANPVENYGKEAFFARCRETGVDGIIIPDVPFEEKDEFDVPARANGVDLISLIAPTSLDRISMIAKEARGFVYCVSSLGVTGVRSNIVTDLEPIVKSIRAATDTPVAIGFGISTPAQVAEYGKFADGVIVGSALMKLVERDGAGASEAIEKFIRQLNKNAR
ncbi:MAG: tryptophan synthase subunit alpha [Bacillota bacterium]